MTDRNAFLRPTPRRFKELVRPDGVPCRIRSVTEAERQQFEMSIKNRKGDLIQERIQAIRLRYLVLCLVDAQGNPLLTLEDLPALAQLDSAITIWLADAIREHCGWDATDAEALAKNFAPTPSGDSPSN